MRTFIAATLVGASAIGVELEGAPSGGETVWNGDVSGFKHGNYESIPEIAAAKKSATIQVTGEIPELGAGMNYGKFGKGQSYGLFDDAFPSFGSFGSFPGFKSFGKARLHSGLVKNEEAIPGGIDDLKNMSGIKTLNEQPQIEDQLNKIHALKGLKDLEGVDGGLTETKETRSIGEYGGYAGYGTGYGLRANAAFGLRR